MPVTCNVKHCYEMATHKLPGTKYPTLCGDHKLKKMVYHHTKQCAGDECPIKPTFGEPGTYTAIFCSDCRPPDFKDVMNRDCKKCTTRGSFIYKKMLYCAAHAPEGSKLYGYKRCCVEKCDDKACYNFPKGDPTEAVCSYHKQVGMKSCKNRLCITDGCTTFANYNLPGITPPIHCEEHREKKMINVTSKLCLESGCPHQPYFALKGETVGRYCEEHKDLKMVDVRHKMCEECGEKRAIYQDDKGVTRFCTKDGKRLFPPKKGENRSSNGSKTCDECDRQCNFGFKGELATKCSLHQKPGMINVKTKRCEHCHKNPASYGYRFTTPTMCRIHKRPGMVPRNKILERCLECRKVAKFCKGKSRQPTKCEDHKTKGYHEILNKKCIRCSNKVPITDAQNVCDDCAEVINPSQPRKGKEVRIQKVLEANEIEIASHDLKVDGGCSSRRPDFIIDCDFFFIIVEVDENQHNSTPCECEVVRMIELFQDFGGTPLMFIRYNPDAYKDHNDKTIRGTKENPRREKRLVKLIHRIQNSVTEDDIVPLSAYYLFFDGDDGKDRWLKLDYESNTVQELVNKITDCEESANEETEDE